MDDLEKKVGQLLVVGISGTSVDQKTLKLLTRIGVGGVILFEKNFENIESLCELTNTLQKGIAPEAYKALPAFIGVDHEGGKVQRFKDPFTCFPPMAKLGELDSAKTAFEVGYVMGKELKAAGVNLNFAPVLDVAEDFEAPGLWDRIFSTNPEVVGNVGSGVIRGIQKGGCVGVLKHFPGHGSVRVDSHKDLPVCDKSVEELAARDWIPFKKAIRARAEAVMTAHIMYPQIDPSRPATMSRKILQQHLRKDLRHSKLIFSDDLEMGAIANRYSLDEAAFLSIEAGCDQVLLCHSYDQIENTWLHLLEAFRSGALPPERLDESLERIEKCKERYLLPLKYADKDLAKAIIGAPGFTEVSKRILEGKTVEEGPSTLAC